MLVGTPADSAPFPCPVSLGCLGCWPWVSSPANTPFLQSCPLECETLQRESAPSGVCPIRITIRVWDVTKVEQSVCIRQLSLRQRKPHHHTLQGLHTVWQDQKSRDTSSSWCHQKGQTAHLQVAHSRRIDTWKFPPQPPDFGGHPMDLILAVLSVGLL